jgi:hypothetical protein
MEEEKRKFLAHFKISDLLLNCDSSLLALPYIQLDISPSNMSPKIDCPFAY